MFTTMAVPPPLNRVPLVMRLLIYLLYMPLLRAVFLARRTRPPYAARMWLLVLALAGVKWVLLSVVIVLAVGKAIARVVLWVVNNACQGGPRLTL